MAILGEWDNFYVIVGSAAGALIGLQFVVMTLIANRPPPRASEAGQAFATPTIIHFSSVLFMSAYLQAPWHSVAPVALLWGCMGLSGFVYIGYVARRMVRQDVYEPVFEDWLFHVLMPLVAYGTLAVSACTAVGDTRDSLFGVGAAGLVLLFVGIHNAWDSVAYHVWTYSRKPDPKP